ncbi:hypothetical protein SCA6_007718 [Theobroma cacao]
MAANHHELAQDKMVQEKPIGDVFAVHVCLLVLSGTSKSGPSLMSGIERRVILQSLKVLLWAPFLNFRKFPRDPSLKYPWDTPKDPSQVKYAYLKYPFAKPEDYDG